MKGFFKKTFKGITVYCDLTKDDHTSAFAAQSAFFILLAFFPMINITLAFVKFLPVTEDQVMDFLERVLSTERSGFISDLVQDLFHYSAGSVTIISIVIGLWSAARGMLAIRDGINVVYKAEEKKNYFLKRIISALYTLIFIVMIIVLTLVSVFGTQIVKLITKRAPGLKNITSNILTLRAAFVFVMMFVILCFLYTVMPSRRVKLRRQIGGALVASVLWAVMNNLFNIYINKVVMKSYAYGGLTMAIVLMFWLYFGVTFILIGGQVNSFLERTDMLRTIFKNDGTKPYVLSNEEVEERNRRRRDRRKKKAVQEESTKTEQSETKQEESDIQKTP